MFIDSHCHLNFKVFHRSLKKVIAQAKQAGVIKFVVPGTDIVSSREAVALAGRYPQVYATVGIHPHHGCVLKRSSLISLKDELIKLAVGDKVIAIGECGLDYYQYSKTKYPSYRLDGEFIGLQKKLFLMQARLAEQLNLPLIIHNRQANLDLVKLITDHLSLFANLKGVFHSFEGSPRLAVWALKHHFYFGINGLITVNEKLLNFLKTIPLKKMILETDAPFLIPKGLKKISPFPNTPANISFVAQVLAKIKNISTKEIAQATTDNCQELFGF